MARSSRRISALLVCGACLLGCAAAIAAAAPRQTSGERARTHQAGHHAKRCAKRARSHGARSRRGARCHAQRRSAAHPPATAPPAGTPDSVRDPGGAASPLAGRAPTQVSTPPLLTPTIPAEVPSTSGGPPSVPHVEVTAVEYSFSLSRTTVPAGKVILQFVNHGQDEHNLNAVPAEGELAGSIPNTHAGEVRQQEVELRPGSYTLFCSLPEHEKKGMKATLVVE